MSFVSDRRGWMLAGRGCGSVGCPRSVILSTDDYGRSWHRIWRSAVGISEENPAPIDISDIRFANARDGWVFGGALYATRDGGRSWSRIHAPAVITDLEASEGRVYAVGAECNTTGGSCEWGRIYTTTVGADRLRPVAGLPRFGQPGGFFSATLTLHGQAVYAVIESSPDGHRLVTSADGNTWAVRRLPCPRPDEPPPMLAAFSDRGLVLVCSGEPGAGNQQKILFTSSDGGSDWQRAGAGPVGGYTTSLAAAAPATWFLALDRGGVAVTSDASGHWRSSIRRDPGDSGFSWTGFTDATHGVAISGYFRSHRAWLTRSGGSRWYKGP